MSKALVRVDGGLPSLSLNFKTKGLKELELLGRKFCKRRLCRGEGFILFLCDGVNGYQVWNTASLNPDGLNDFYLKCSVLGGELLKELKGTKEFKDVQVKSRELAERLSELLLRRGGLDG